MTNTARKRGLAFDFVHLCALSTLAIAQPLLDLLGRNATFFSVRDAGPLEVVTFALVVTLGPPAALFLLELLVLPISRRARRGLHLVFVGGLGALFVLQLGARTSAAIVAAAALAGVALAAGYARFRPTRAVLTALSPAPLVIVVLFAVVSSASGLVLPGGETARAGTVAAKVPVIVVVFDEFSLNSILDSRGRVDPVRYPNLAKLAAGSTWFPRATTVSPWTEQAVPALLTGVLPSEGTPPVLREHPNNLFTLLGSSHSVHAVEPITKLCPRTVCASTGPREVPSGLRLMLTDAGVVYLSRVAPTPLAGRLPPVTTRWGNFLADTGDAAPDSGEQGRRNRSASFERFVSSLRPARRPTLHFLHILLPHHPWQYFPGGTRYVARNENTAGLTGERWGASAELVTQGQQRYLLQVGYVDTLVGRLVEQLKAQGLYDESLLVITSDHGVGFEADGSLRTLTPANASDIAFVPLFVKAPHQRRGRVDERSARTIDVLPTIADVLGAKLEWRTEGRSLLDPTGGRGDVDIEVDGERLNLEALGRQQRRAVDDRARSFGERAAWSELFVATTPEASGRRTSDLRIVDRPGSAEFDDVTLYADVDPASSFVPAEVTGRVAGGAARPGEKLAVAVNGRIAGLASTFVAAGTLRFSALVPPEEFRAGSNRIELLRPVSLEAATFERLAATEGGPRMTLAQTPRGEVIRIGRGRTIRIVQGAIVGAFDYLESGSSELRFVGWAADVPNERVRDQVLVFDGGRLVSSTTHHVERPDLQPGLRSAGFDFIVPRDRLSGPGPARVRVLAVVGNLASELGCVGRSVRSRDNLLAHCGRSSAAPDPARLEQLLTRSDLASAETGTPKRALLTWWSHLQQRRLAGYIDAFSEPLRATLKSDPRTRLALDAISPAIRTGRPTILSVVRAGERATVYTRILYRQRAAAGGVKTVPAARAFVLVRQDGRWLLAEDFFVQSSVPDNVRRR